MPEPPPLVKLGTTPPPPPTHTHTHTHFWISPGNAGWIDSYHSPSHQRWWYTLVNFHWAHVRFRPVPFASCGNGSCDNSPAAVSFTVLSQTSRRPILFQNSTIAWAMLICFGYRIASKSEKAYLRPYHWARIPIKHRPFGYSRLNMTK